MGRPRNDEIAARAQVQPPAYVDGALLDLWHREFDRFPPGYFTACDVAGMLRYLDWLTIYEMLQHEHARAKPARKVAVRAEMMRVQKLLNTSQRALRMFPITRTNPITPGRMAADPTQQPVTPEPPGKARCPADAGRPTAAARVA